jgi:hypothetical protein
LSQAGQPVQRGEERERLFEQDDCDQSGGLIALRVRDRPALNRLAG